MDSDSIGCLSLIGLFCIWAGAYHIWDKGTALLVLGGACLFMAILGLVGRRK